MTIGVLQIMVIVLIGVLLFGDMPKRAEELKKAVKIIRGESESEEKKKEK